MIRLDWDDCGINTDMFRWGDRSGSACGIGDRFHRDFVEATYRLGKYCRLGAVAPTPQDVFGVAIREAGGGRVFCLFLI